MWYQYYPGRYHNHSNNSNHPIIRTPPFFRKNCNPSIRTPTFEIIIPISECLHFAELEGRLPNVYQPSTVSVELERGLPSSSILQAFSNVYQTTTVTAELERELPNLYQPSTVTVELERALLNVYQQSLRSSNGDCQNVQYPSTVSAGIEQGSPNVLRQSLRSSNGGQRMGSSKFTQLHEVTS